MTTITDWIWSEKFWLPEGMSYPDNELHDYGYPSPRHLLYLPFCALAHLVFRQVLGIMIAPTIAKMIGIPVKNKMPAHNFALEKFYSSCPTPTVEQMETLTEDSGWSSRKIANWFIRRRRADRPGIFDKFVETLFKGVVIGIKLIMGAIILSDAPWLWDNSECWTAYPDQSLWPSVHIYYMYSGGYYLSIILTLLVDVKRSDYYEMIVHHYAALFLIIFSYGVNFVRIGTLVMIIHDVSTPFLYLGKILVYCKSKHADAMFTFFAASFIISRMFVYPYSVLYNLMVRFPRVYPTYPGFYAFSVFLLVLWSLHINWACVIVKMAIIKHQKGTVEKDCRSEESEKSLTSEEDNGKKD